MSGAPPSDPVAALSALAASILALPHGRNPSLCLGYSDDAFDAIRAVEGHTLIEHPDEEEPPFRPACRSCRCTIDGVEFYAMDRGPRR